MQVKFAAMEKKSHKRINKKKRGKRKQSRNGSMEIKDLYRCYQVGVNAIMDPTNITQNIAFQPIQLTS